MVSGMLGAMDRKLEATDRLLLLWDGEIDVRPLTMGAAALHEVVMRGDRDIRCGRSASGPDIWRWARPSWPCAAASEA